MAEPFKNLINADTVRAAATHLKRAWPPFDARRFEALALQGLDELAMKARAMQLCAALEATLPADFEQAAAIIEASLAPARDDDDLAALRRSDAGLAGWVVWPLTEFVARRGLHEPKRALRALHALTQRFTAEWAIRPFIEAHPDLVLRTLAAWAHDPSAHVRRLVSEGSRPRLPWGLRLQALVRDPSPTLPLLAELQDDPSEEVRRSVANHLNDIAKDHPELVVHWLHQHLPGASPARRALLRHASRTLIKQGHRGALRAWGMGAAWRGDAVLELAPRRVRLGGELKLTLHLRSALARPQRLAIDYAVHHVKADGSRTPKVFKGWQVELPPHGTATRVKRHSLRPVTTRRYHGGEHALSVQINGRTVAEASFMLVMPKAEESG